MIKIKTSDILEMLKAAISKKDSSSIRRYCAKLKETGVFVYPPACLACCP